MLVVCSFLRVYKIVAEVQDILPPQEVRCSSDIYFGFPTLLILGKLTNLLIFIEMPMKIGSLLFYNT